MNGLVEEVIEQQVLEVGVCAVSIFQSESPLRHLASPTYALVMSFKKTDRMIQPPRHMSAISGLFSFQLYSLAAYTSISTGKNAKLGKLAF